MYKRSKVLYSNFSLGGPQPTHLYDFSISLCGVTQGNHAKHKLGARFAQGWRKCFHACVDYHNTFYISHILYVYRFYHQSFSWIHILCMHNRCEIFAEVLAEHVNSAGPQSEKSSCIFRASPAQAPRKQKDASSWM